MAGLEHCYYGQLVHHGRVKGEPRILARSRGVTEDMVSTALKVARLPARADLPRSAWALVRSKEVPFILVQAQLGAGDQVMRHFVFLPPDLPRSLTGAVGELQQLILDKLPVYEMLGDSLPALEFVRPTPRGLNEQVNDLLELMTHTGNNTRTLEPLLSAVAEGRVLAVRQAPPDPQTRIDFVEGLLTLLPPSTRFSITFALHNDGGSDVSAQICFMDDPAPEGAVVYDWPSHRVYGLDTPTEYSRFIVSQLRLDAQVAVQQAEALTQTAGWRFRVGDTLAESLDYASYRAKLDRSVLSALPVEAKDVAQVLADDPTLDDGLRISYARHLLLFSLALETAEHADPVAVTMSKYPDLARDIFLQMEGALAQGQSGVVFDILHAWSDNPLSPQGPEWVELLYRSAQAALLKAIKDKDADSIHTFLEETQLLEGGPLLEKISPRLIEALVTVADIDAELPPRILLMALTYLEKPAVQRLLANKAYATTLPRSIKRFLAALATREVSLPAGVLVEAARAVGELGQDQALIRLTDMAHSAERHELIDAPALRELVKVARSPLGNKYGMILLNVARAANDRMETLGDEAARAVLQLFLACRRVDLLAKSMIELSREVFGTDRQEHYVEMVRAVMAEVPFTAVEARKTLEALSDHGIKDVPLMMAVCGALEAAQHPPELRDYACEIADELTSAERYAELVAPQAILSLLNYFMRQPDEPRLYQVSLLMARVAALNSDDKASLGLISQAYKAMQAQSAAAGFGLLRHYVRLASSKPAERVASFYGKEIGGDAERQLRLAYELSLFMNRLSPARYAQACRAAAELLQALAEAYAGREKPHITFLDALLENLRVRIDSAKHQVFASGLQRLARTLLHIGKPDNKTGVLGDPASVPRLALDALRSIGVQLNKGRAIPLKLRQEGKSPSPLGPSTPMQLVEDVNQTADLLRAAMQGFSGGKGSPWTVAGLTAELEDLLKTVPADQVAALNTQWASDVQRLAQLIPLIVQGSDPAVLQDDNRIGKKLDSQSQQPRNPLELMRFIYGYWLG